MAKSRLTGRKPGEKVTGRLKCAVFGTGYWSTLQIPGWHQAGGVEIVAAYNRTVEKAEKIAHQFGIPRVYADAEELMTKEEFDFADIITEAPGHEWLTALAAKHGIPVICQKPMSDSLEACRNMVAACKKARVPLFINENYRWQPPFRAAKKAIQEGQIGKLIRGRVQIFNCGAPGYLPQPYLTKIKHPALQDCGPHFLDLCRFFFGEIESVCALTIQAIDFLEGDDTAMVLVKAGGLPVTCEFGEFTDSRLFIEGHNGTITVDNDNVLHIATRDGQKISTPTDTTPRFTTIPDSDWQLHGPACIHSIVDCQKSFVDAFRDGTLPETNAEDNFKTMLAVFAAIRSVEDQRQVHLRELACVG